MERYKIIKMEHDITTEEVEGLKDFSALLKTHKKSLIKKRMLLSLIPISIMIGSAIYFYAPANSNLTSTNLTVAPKNTPLPKVVKDSAAYDSNQDSIVVKLKKTKKSTKKFVKKKPIKKEEINTPSYSIEFVKATPSYGLDSLMNYLHIELNKKALPTTNGNLVVAFTIDTFGKPKAIKIMQGVSSKIDEEIITLVKNMPAWQPAQMDGKPVASTTTLPIKIVINSIKEEN